MKIITAPIPKIMIAVLKLLAPTSPTMGRIVSIVRTILLNFPIFFIFFSKLIKVLTGKKITDPTSGLRMIGRNVMALFATDYPRDYPEPESTVRLIRHKRKIEEVPVIMRERAEGVSSLSSVRHSVYYMIKVSIAILVEKWR